MKKRKGPDPWQIITDPYLGSPQVTDPSETGPRILLSIVKMAEKWTIPILMVLLHNGQHNIIILVQVGHDQNCYLFVYL
jgi:hypothetical protein